jgi:hypothetical protein
MADDETAVQGGTDEPQAPASNIGGSKTYNEDYVKQLREEAKENRLESKALRTEVTQLKAQLEKIGNPQELVDRLQRIEAEREADRIRAKAAEDKALRLEIGVEFALPPELAEVLKGETAEELRAHAEKLKPYVATAPEPDGLRRRPSTTPVPGGAPAGETDAQRRARIFGNNGNSGAFG